MLIVPYLLKWTIYGIKMVKTHFYPYNDPFNEFNDFWTAYGTGTLIPIFPKNLASSLRKIND